MSLHSFPIGMQVIVWARPEPDLILLFGEGTFDGTNVVNGNQYPVIKFANGREMTCHYQGVEVGRKDAVVKTCQSFSGDIMEWDIEAYLAGKKPERAQRAAAAVASGQPMAEPKTVTDKLLYMRREIELEEAKIVMGQKVIDDAKAVIAAKRDAMRTIKQQVLDELAKIEDGPLPETVKVEAPKVIEAERAPVATVTMDQSEQLALED